MKVYERTGWRHHSLVPTGGVLSCGLCGYDQCARRRATPRVRPVAGSRILTDSVLRTSLSKSRIQKYLARMRSDLSVIASLLISVLLLPLAVLKASLS